MKTAKIYPVIMMVLFTVLASLFAGCDSETDSGNGDVIVRWDIAGLKVCQAYLPPGKYTQDNLVFDRVEITLYENANSKVPVQDTISLPCNAFQTNISRLPWGNYYVKIDAYAIYNDESYPFFVGSADIALSGERSIVDIPLEVSSGKLVVGWNFASQLLCGVNVGGDVASVVIALNGVQTEASCGDAQIVFEDMSSANTYKVTAMALDSDGNILSQAVCVNNPFEVLPGQTTTQEVIFP